MRLLLSVFLCALSASAQSPTVTGPHVSVTLTSQNTALTKGGSNWIGLHFKLEKGWHVYWTDPGDSGEPPKADWQLPAGFKAGALEFPAPRRLPLQTLMNFGYEDEVLYPIKLDVPANAAGNVKLIANVRWMVCADTCIPGKGTVAITLPTGAAAQPGPQAKLFTDTLARLPKPLPASGRTSAVLNGEAIMLSLARSISRDTIRAAEFFPLDDFVIENAAPQLLDSKPGDLRLRLKRSEQAQKPPARLRGVLVINGSRAFSIDIPIRQPKPSTT